MLNFIGVGEPGQVRQAINGALDNLPIAKSKSDLAQLMTDTDNSTGDG
jgi:hypothetical protein